jgi:hypothetical protein
MDNSAVHPESYGIVENGQRPKVTVNDLIIKNSFDKPEHYVSRNRFIRFKNYQRIRKNQVSILELQSL